MSTKCTLSFMYPINQLQFEIATNDSVHSWVSNCQTTHNHHQKGSFRPGVLFYQKQGFFGEGFLFQPSCEHVVDQSDLVPRNIGSLAQRWLVVKVMRRKMQLLMIIPSISIYVLSGDGMFRPSILSGGIWILRDRS